MIFQKMCFASLCLLIGELQFTSVQSLSRVWLSVTPWIAARPASLSEKALATHSGTLAWKIPWTEKPGRLQSMASQRVGHDWATSLSLSCIGAGNGNPLQYSCLENPRDGGAWWAAVYGVAESDTTKQLTHTHTLVQNKNKNLNQSYKTRKVFSK